MDLDVARAQRGDREAAVALARDSATRLLEDGLVPETGGFDPDFRRAIASAELRGPQ